MEVKRDFAKRMTGLAESLPREVLASLLTRLMPSVPVATRAPAAPPWAKDARASMDAPTTSRDPFVRAAMRRKRRPRAVASRPYSVLRPYALNNHRRGTWTYYMVKAALDHDCTGDAEAWLRASHPEFDHKVIDWQWLVDVKYYIRYL